MTPVLLGAAGILLGGPLLGVALAGAPILLRARRAREMEAPYRAVLLVMLVELGSGSSVLASLNSLAIAFPEDPTLARVSRLALVGGLAEASRAAPRRLSSLLSQLVRAQKSGAPLASTVRHLLEADVAAERSAKLARARTLPVRLMIPIALFLLPGLLLIVYGPGLVALVEDIGGPLT